jgi:anti-sigma B factor antagonist
VIIRGVLDISTAAALKADLLDVLNGGGSRLVVELELTGQIDSSGLAVLVGVHRRLERAGGALVLLIDDPHLAHKFKAVGLDRMLTIVGSRDEALAELGAD